MYLKETLERWTEGVRKCARSRKNAFLKPRGKATSTNIPHWGVRVPARQGESRAQRPSARGAARAREKFMF